MSLITVDNLKKDYTSGKLVVRALQGVDFTVERGEFVSVVGPSGCGKSTLLYVLGGMLTASGGRVTVDGLDITGASGGELTAYRRKKVGFVFQKFNLISSLSVAGNLEIAGAIRGRRAGAVSRIETTLENVGLTHKRGAKPLELSQGEQQRVAIARALVKEPALILADEPTGNLDSENSDNILRLFRDLSDRQGQTIVMITHNRSLAAETDRIISMKDGRTVPPGLNTAAAEATGTKR
jgi:putative ABC transport system ATP-binding protein